MPAPAADNPDTMEQYASQGKYTRDGFLRSDEGQYLLRFRQQMGAEAFDSQYDALYRFVTSLCVGQWFLITSLCRRNPDNRSLVAHMLVMLDQMDIHTNLIFDSDDAFVVDRVEIGPPLDVNHRLWPPPNMWLKIRENPKEWGIDESLLE